MNKSTFLVIEGNIGAGKTSLTKLLANKLNARTILERFKDNPFLPKFYQDPERYAFQVETSFLIDRYWQLKDEIFDARELFTNMIIADYYFPKSIIFAKKTLKDDEFRLFRNIFDIIYKNIPKPDLYVYLHLKPENLLENIRKRGREYERNITAEYLKKIEKSYFEFFKEEKNIPFLIIDTNNLDFVHNKKDFDTIYQIIFAKNYPIGITIVE